jgi:tetratricopeptide (TPR) repeat protein
MAPATRRRIVRQKAKGPIDPHLGARVRALRIARGLTQEQLAGPDFSKGFISLVETGRTRISLRAAQVLATRLGVLVVELMVDSTERSQLAIEIDLTRAETELRAGRADAALDLLRSVRPRLSGLIAARADRLAGLALLARRSTRDAIERLEAARGAFLTVGDRAMSLRTTFDLARAYGRGDAHGRSLALALEVDRGITSGDLIDRSLELQVIAYLASKFVTIGDNASADLYAERARALAEDVSDPPTLAHLYMTLAITRQEQGNLDAALEYARKSLRTYDDLGDRPQVGSAWNTMAWVYVQRKQYPKAEEALARSERIAAELKDQRLLGYVVQTRAELELARGNAAEAARLAQASATVPDIAPRCRALSLLVYAQAIAATAAPTAEVESAFASALRELAPEGQALVARAHRAYFDALRARGQFKEAAEEADRALALLRPGAA